MKHRVFTREDESQEATTFCATKLMVDRYDEVVVPKGCEETLDDYKANPVLHYGHMTSAFWFGAKNSLPIGRAVNLRFSEDTHEKFGATELLFDAEFSKSNDLADVVRGLVEERMLNAVSIGFHPVRMSTSKEDRLTDGQKGITHLKWNLLENSIVPIPANQGSLRRSISGSPTLQKFQDLLLAPEIKVDDGVYRGETSPASDGHTHTFLVEVREGSIVMGATSYEDNHFHAITDPTSTDREEDHSHSITLEMKATTSDIVTRGLGLPAEVLSWSRDDVEAVKRFLALRDELHSPKPKNEDGLTEELSKMLQEVSGSLYDPSVVIQEGVSKAFKSHIRGK